MGVWLTKNHIEIANAAFDNKAIIKYRYNDITDEMIESVASDSQIYVVQISEELPEAAYVLIDKMLERKSDLVFRIYGLYGLEKFDISFLKKMPHLHHLRIDCHLVNCPALIDFNILTELNLKSVSIDAFDLHDYSFIQYLSDDLEKITINADTMSGSINFDCKWLLKYKKLHTLWLGKKAKKNIECLAQIELLKSLTLRGIKLSDFEFLKSMNLESFDLLWNSNNDLSELKELKTLKNIGLWRINKLDNIDFIGELENLEVIKLQDLKHVKSLPDLNKLKYLKRIVLDNTGINFEELNESIQQITECY